MIRLKPRLEIPETLCPKCGAILSTSDWLITGMRNLADFRCPHCASEFYGDLPAGQGLYTPILLDKASGKTFNDYNAEWFAEWLGEAYRDRETNAPLPLRSRRFFEPKKSVVLLNCLDTLYGHSLLKLLNAQHYIDRQPETSLIILIPSMFEWMLPEGSAEAWIVDLPLKKGTIWNDDLAREIKGRLESFPEVFLSPAFSHPHAQAFDIERFTKIKPFPLENFGKRKKNPFVTFIWREDRLWEEADLPRSRFERIKRNLKSGGKRIEIQRTKVIEFAENLRKDIPQMDFAVAGLGDAGGLPDWIKDWRVKKMDAGTECAFCERYAMSELVVGVHGSNMLLPSAHAGGVIELIGEERWGNFMQDVLFRPSDAREMFFRYRFVPHRTSPESLARLAALMLGRFEDFQRLMGPAFSRYQQEGEERAKAREEWLSDKLPTN